MRSTTLLPIHAVLPQNILILCKIFLNSVQTLSAVARKVALFHSMDLTGLEISTDAVLLKRSQEVILAPLRNCRTVPGAEGMEALLGPFNGCSCRALVLAFNNDIKPILLGFAFVGMQRIATIVWRRGGVGLRKSLRYLVWS